MQVRMLRPTVGSVAQMQRVFLCQFIMAFAILFVSVGASAADRPDSFADQVEKLSPAVVNISTTTTVNDGQAMDMPQFPPGSPFEEFFKNFGDNTANAKLNRSARASSSMMRALSLPIIMLSKMPKKFALFWPMKQALPLKFWDMIKRQILRF
jgi:S1-C subfamily serine protease